MICHGVLLYQICGQKQAVFPGFYGFYVIFRGFRRSFQPPRPFLVSPLVFFSTSLRGTMICARSPCS